MDEYVFENNNASDNTKLDMSESMDMEDDQNINENHRDSPSPTNDQIGVINLKPTLSQGNRRKQSKPNRVKHLQNIQNKENVISNDNEMECAEDQTSRWQQSEENVFNNAKYQKQRSVFNCDSCPETHETYEDLAWHQYEAHRRILKFGDDVSESLPLDTETDEDARMRENAYIDNNREMDMDRSEGKMNNDEDDDLGLVTESSRKNDVFNLNVCCDLCSREFCNKYFLKIHLANKHGIQDDSLPVPDNVPGPVFPHDENRWNPDGSRAIQTSSSLTESTSPLPLPANLTSQTTPVTAMGNIPIPSTLHGAGSPPLSLLSRPMSPLPKLNGMSHLYNPLGMPDKPQTPGSGEKKQRSIEDFCELCQKHFCNKYYLRKHKMDVHGIHSEAFSVRRRMGGSSANGSSDRSLDLNFGQGMMMPQHIPTSMSNFMLMNPFAPMMNPLPPDPMLFQRLSQMGHDPALLHANRDEKPVLMSPLDVKQEVKEPRSVEGNQSPGANDRRSPDHPPETPVRSHTHYIDQLMNKHDREADRRELNHTASDGSKSDEVDEQKRKHSESEFHRSSQSTTEKSADIQKSPETAMDFSSTIVPKLEKQQHNASLADARRSPPALTPDQPDTTPKREPTKPCDICLKEFADSFALRMHKLNFHGIEPAKAQPEDEPKAEKPPLPLFHPGSAFHPATSDYMRLPHMPFPFPSSMGLPFPGSNPALTSPAEAMDPMSSMFSSMVAAKLADRVTCDICNKDVCNKYFLKTHKVKMHGIDPATLTEPMTPPKTEGQLEAPNGEVPPPQETPLQEPYPPEIPIPRPTSAGLLGEMDDRQKTELLKVGIDPEAYCEICKKEFCSKYFLRTHKLNMHGIPTDKPGNRKEDREISRREIMERELLGLNAFAPLYPPLQMAPSYPMMMGALDGQTPLRDLHRNPGHPLFTPQQLISRSFDEESVGSNKSDKSKSKDPVANSMRVKCELCNKELCNKYFLRTHKMKKHGIVDDFLSESQQKKLIEMQKQGLIPLSATPGSNGLSKHKYSSLGLDSSQNGRLNSSMVFPGTPRIPEVEQRQEKERERPVACHLCPRTFSSTETLTMHVYMEHNSRRELQERRDQDLSEARRALFDRRHALPCQICGMICPDQIGLQLHMVQEHAATINITPEKNGDENGMDVPSADEMNQRKLEDERRLVAGMDEERRMAERLDEELNRMAGRLNENLERSQFGHPDERHAEPIHSNQYGDSVRKRLEYVDPQQRRSETLAERHDQYGDQAEQRLEEHQGLERMQEDSIENVPSENVEPVDTGAQDDQKSSEPDRVAMSLRRYQSTLTKYRLYSCSRCRYKARWFRHLQAHEERKHGIKRSQKRKQISGSESDTGYGSTDMDYGTLSKSMDSHHCPFCKKAFRTRKARNTHQTECEHAKNFPKRRCTDCDFSTRDMTKLKQHRMTVHLHGDQDFRLNGLTNGPLTNGLNRKSGDENEEDSDQFIMQKFTISDQDSADNFAKAHVYLPVLRKVDGPVTVSFQLTPSDQQRDVLRESEIQN